MTTAHQSTARLSDVAISITDGDHQAPPQASQGIPFVTISALNDGNLNIDKATRHVPETYYSSLKKERKPEIGDILFSVTGSIAIPAIVDDPRPFTFQRHIAIIKPNAAIVDNRYLLHALRTDEIKEQALAVATGTAQLTIPLGGLRNFEFPLPPLQEQRRIVVKLDSLRARSTRARHELDLVPKLIERYKQAILAKAFSGELTKDWRHGNNKSWHPQQKPLDQLVLNDAPIVYGVIQPGELRDAGIPLVRVCDIEDGHINWRDVRTISNEINEQYQRSLVTDGDLLVSIVGTIGRIGIVENAPPIVNIARAVARLRICSEIALAKWVYYCLMGDAIQWQLLREAREVARKTLNLEQLRTTQIPVPDIQEQLEAVHRIETAFAWLDKIATEHARASHLLPKLDQAILAKAFRGDLVPQDPNDEPASVLLERIKGEREGAERTRRRRVRT